MNGCPAPVAWMCRERLPEADPSAHPVCSGLPRTEFWRKCFGLLEDQCQICRPKLSRTVMAPAP
eukprot:11558791-Alexandrium_andersonii.AAC.1